MFNIIVCTDSFNGIGKENTIPWKLTADLKRFRELTSKTSTESLKNAIIMGRKTWESLPRKPLPGRINIIISSTLNQDDFSDENILVCSSFDEALVERPNVEKYFVIGGGRVYQDALCDPRCSRVYLTRIEGNFRCDVFFPPMNEDYKLVEEEEMVDENLNYKNMVYHRVNRDEIGYLNLLKEILSEGIEKNDRTGVGIISTFGKTLSFDLKRGFPLLTSKFTPFKLTAKELLWFISGSTDNAVLKEKGVHIWDGNTTQEFIDKMGLPYGEDDLGPMYGFQWRYAGAEYVDCHTDYRGKGVDQVRKVINLIKNDPCSRRIILNSYNVPDLDKMVLNPCHCMVQFYVDTVRNELSAQMYQRSADMFLGVPINIASYALLTHMIAHVCGMGVGKLVICYGDAHIYKNHLEQVAEQLSREERVKPFPRLKIMREVRDIEDFTSEDFMIVEYEREGRIKAPMAV